jgi:hypothetical protein
VCLPSSFSAASALYIPSMRDILPHGALYTCIAYVAGPPFIYINFRRQDGYCRMLHIHLEIRNSWASRSLLLGGAHLILYCYRTNGFDYTVQLYSNLCCYFTFVPSIDSMWVHTNSAAQSIITQFHFDRQKSNFKAPAAAHIVLSYFNRYRMVISSWKPWESYEIIILGRS